MFVEVTTWYVEMTAPADLRPSRSPHADVLTAHVSSPMPELNRFLYTAVGGDWFWVDRLGWSYVRWFEYLNRPELETWVAYLSGTPAGYFELERQARGAVELAYFGLLPQFIGRGIGRLLLTHAVERAWELGARRVWLHTCTLDSPAALNNYRARGFRVYREETEEKELPDRSPGPWPGAR